MKGILLKDGEIVDIRNNRLIEADLLIENGIIKEISNTISAKSKKVINCKDLIISPGFIDMHVHLREPGMEEEETIASGLSAAVNGGFTTVVCMPNTEPAVDNEASAEFVFLQSARANKAQCFPIGAITKGREGKELSEMGQLVRAGAVAFSDDGDFVQDSSIMLRALQYAKMFNKPIISHCEDKTLSRGGVMNAGYVSMLLGLPGIPAAAEEIAVYRDIKLTEISKSRLHIAHVSTKGTVNLIREAKTKGINITAEVTPHHLLLTEEKIKTFNTNYKMNPPLRTEEDRLSLIEGLKDGTIDVIVSDHAPHTLEEKEMEFINAPFGVIGLESTFPVLLTGLYHSGIMGLISLIKKFTINPAIILGLDGGIIEKGKRADLTVVDTEEEWCIDVEKFKSKSRNCPFDKMRVKGAVKITIVGGKIFRSNMGNENSFCE